MRRARNAEPAGAVTGKYRNRIADGNVNNPLRLLCPY